MELSRRHLAAAGALALGASSLLQHSPALAESGDEAAVKQAIETLRKGTLEQDKTKLEAITAEQVSYGHSSGQVQNKAEFINGVMTRKGTTKSIEFPELTVAVVGNTAVARHLYVSEGELDGKPTNVKIGLLQVWQKQEGGWKLLARQGFKLA